MFQVALSLGTNIENRYMYISAMENALLDILTAPILKSDIYLTEPVAVKDIQPWYLNRIISGWFEDNPQQLLIKCNNIEKKLGRNNKGKQKKRTADIDILIFGDKRITSQQLTIPHPAIIMRRFCLEGLYTILPDISIGHRDETIRYYYHTMDSAVRKQVIHSIAPGNQMSYGAV